MHSSVTTQELVPQVTVPVVEPSRSVPQADPVREVQEVVDAIRLDSQTSPREYLDEIRVVLGAE